MKLKALDTVKITSVSRDKLHAGDEFVVSDDVGAALVARGLAAELKPPVIENKEAAKPKAKGKV
jgi:hypothetical protein